MENKRIALVVDDSKVVSHILTLYLERGGFVVHVAENGEEALTITRDIKDPITIAFIDIHLPTQETGTTLITHLQEQRPEMQILLITGSGPGVDDETDALLHKYPHLLKPFPSLCEFLRKVEATINPTDGNG